MSGLVFSGYRVSIGKMKKFRRWMAVIVTLSVNALNATEPHT